MSCPDLLENLVGINFRFFEHEIALTSDIKAIFWQVKVPQAIKRRFYTDDSAKSAVTEKQPIDLHQQLIPFLRNGWFKLSKWLSNSVTVVEAFDDATRRGRV